MRLRGNTGIALLLLGASQIVFADSVSAAVSSSINLAELKQTCKTSPYDCLAKLNGLIEKTPENSRLFYNLLQFRFDSLFNLQQRHQLYQETKPWISKDDLPLAFKTTVNIYYAKAAWFVGDRESSKLAYLVAKESLALMNQAYPSPMRLVIFANLQLQLGEEQQAYELLSSLLKKYPKSPDEAFMMELTGNLGHAANQLGKLEESLVYWQQALHWGQLLGNKQQQAVILYNLADIYFQLTQYPQAEQLLTQTISVAQQANDSKKMNEAKFYLVKARVKTNDVCGALKIYREINLEQLPVRHQQDYYLYQQRFADC